MSNKVIMLAGGQGSRLLPYRTIVPKPLLPLGKRAVLDLVLRQLSRHGFTDVTLAVGELATLIRAMFGDGSRHGISIEYSQEHEPLGTAGVLGSLELDEPFLMMNGNVLTTMNLRSMFEAHERSGNTVTIATHRREVVADFGVLEVDHTGHEMMQVLDYVEKPAATYTVSMGIYAMDPVVRDYIAPDEHLGLPELIVRLLADGHRVGAQPFSGLWLDMRRREDYESATARYEDLAPLFGEADEDALADPVLDLAPTNAAA